MKDLNELLVGAAVKRVLIDSEIAPLNPDFGDSPSLFRIKNDAENRLRHALHDYISTADEVLRIAKAKKATGKESQ